ncbi:MAG: tRNA (adenosine(37)-N6)-threonylcarbamoyltransferase complex ATPase subunit type 1 TsaE [Opitutaceae bacterium]
MSIFAELGRGIETRSEMATREVARRIAEALPPDRAIALSGELGAGKTAFVRGLAAAWSARDPVTSPSYTLWSIYRGERMLVHVDAYRLSTSGAWDALMIEDFLETPWCLAVEWPEHVADRLPDDTLWLRFEMTGDETRRITTTAPT